MEKLVIVATVNDPVRTANGIGKNHLIYSPDETDMSTEDRSSAEGKPSRVFTRCHFVAIKINIV